MKKGIIIATVIIFVLFFYIVVFWGHRPFGAEITQDRPVIKFLCKMQLDCRSGHVQYTCTEDPNHGTYKKLLRWKGFHGCNNLTKGYNDGLIDVEACGSGGIM